MATATKKKKGQETADTGYEGANYTLRELRLSQIFPNKEALRGVDRDEMEFMNLRASIDQHGLFQPVLVREIPHPHIEGDIAYGLIDGLQRFSAVSDLGHETIACNVIDMDQADVLTAQIVANAQRVQTKPAEYTNQLRRILASQPTLTERELANRLNVSVEWLRQRLSLANLHKNIQELVDEGVIKLAHAFALAKIKPPEEQLGLIDEAQTMGIEEFAGVARQRARDLREARHTGKTGPKEFTPVPHLQKGSVLRDEMENNTNRDRVLEAVGAKTAEDGWAAAMLWVNNMDPDSVALAKEEDEARKARKAAEKAALLAEKADKAAKVAAQIGSTNGDGGDEDEDEDEDE